MICETKTKVYECRACGSQKLRKNGRARNGDQRAQCVDCGKTRVLEPRAPRYSEKEKERILGAATLERLSLRAVERTFGPGYRTVKRWAKKKGGGLARAGRHARGRQEGRRARTG